MPGGNLDAPFILHRHCQRRSLTLICITLHELERQTLQELWALRILHPRPRFGWGRRVFSARRSFWRASVPTARLWQLRLDRLVRFVLVPSARQKEVSAGGVNARYANRAHTLRAGGRHRDRRSTSSSGEAGGNGLHAPDPAQCEITSSRAPCSGRLRHSVPPCAGCLHRFGGCVLFRFIETGVPPGEFATESHP
jgi:hypothetical protein